VAAKGKVESGTIKAQSHFSIYCGNFAKKRSAFALMAFFWALLLELDLGYVAIVAGLRISY